MATWINFKELREKIDFAEVLKHYGVEPKVKKESQHQGFCPLPNHQGKRRSPSFSANLERKCFQCFGCQKKGNLIDFCCLMEGMNPDNPTEVRKAALLLQDRFLSGSPSPSPATPKEDQHEKRKNESAVSQKELPVIVNAPLDFTLQGLDPYHPYLKGRGFTPATIAHFGLGFCSKGIMKDRIAIPLHDADGGLIGYAGRLVDDSLVKENNPKYRFPGSRERGGMRYEFQKSRFVYNGFRITQPAAELIVVEGFASVWWLWQNGFSNVVAIMGASCSSEQATAFVRLLRPGGDVVILTDGDESGTRCAMSIFEAVAADRRLRWAKLSKGEQPTDCGAEVLQSLLQT